MVGNPFRKPQAGLTDGHGGQQREERKKKHKKVSFVSPVATPYDPGDHPRFPTLEELEAPPKSPPPKGADYDSIDTAALLRGDLTAGGIVDLAANERLHDASAAATSITPIDHSFQLGQPPATRSKVPVNPFARTLASMEEPNASSKTQESAPKKPALDVDAFKRLLLTGKTGDGHIQRVTSSEHADTVTIRSTPSSLDRDQPDNDSQAVLASDSSSDESDDVVTEDDDTMGNGNSTTVTSTMQTSLSSSASKDDFDDLQPSIEEDASLPLYTSGTVPDESTYSTTEDQTEVSRRSQLPPAPPTARRRGQQAAHTRSRSGSISESSAPLPSPRLPPAPYASSKPRPPPPRAPPPRNAPRNLSRPTLPQATSESSTDSVKILESVRTGVENMSKARPPPPPTRTLGRGSAQNLQRTPSSSSTGSQRRHPSSPNSSTAAVPPPPPPRRSEGKAANGTLEASLTSDTRRLSIGSYGSHRRDSVSSLQRVAEEHTGADAPAKPDQSRSSSTSADMLADLDALQREVDALRAKAFSGR